MVNLLKSLSEEINNLKEIEVRKIILEKRLLNSNDVIKILDICHLNYFDWRQRERSNIQKSEDAGNIAWQTSRSSYMGDSNKFQ